MVRITGSAPVLIVRDVVKAAEYYRDRLGFGVDKLWGEPPNFCMASRDHHVVMLSEAPHGAELRPHWQIVHQLWNAYFWVDDVDSLYAEYQERGAIIDYTLANKPYGVREFGVQDIDGHDLAFGQPLRTGAAG